MSGSWEGIGYGVGGVLEDEVRPRWGLEHEVGLGWWLEDGQPQRADAIGGSAPAGRAIAPVYQTL